MKKILLFDDNLDILQVVEDVLTYEQFDVRTTTKSTLLIQLAEQFQPDLFILDYRLADGNGGEICKEIKAHAQFKHVPVMIFSAYTQPGLNLANYGCEEVLSKPFDIDELLNTVNNLLGTGNKSITEMA